MLLDGVREVGDVRRRLNVNQLHEPHRRARTTTDSGRGFAPSGPGHRSLSASQGGHTPTAPAGSGQDRAILTRVRRRGTLRRSPERHQANADYVRAAKPCYDKTHSY